MNQARVSKIQRQRGKVRTDVVFGKKSSSDGRCCFGVWRSRPGVVSRQQTGQLAQERSMTVRRIAPQASLALDHKRQWKGALHHTSKHHKSELDVGQTPSGFGDVERTQQKDQPALFWHPNVVISNTLATVWIAFRRSVVKCARSQERPFHDDDEAAHEHVTEHMRDLGKTIITRRRLLLRRHRWTI